MYELDFNTPAKIHFTGIGGISMSGLAEIMLSKGFTVTGSDSRESEITKHLESLGATIYTAAVKADNPELVAATEMNIPLLTRAEFLGQIMKNYHTAIGVSGTHGKTTTTSMLSQIMLEANTDPTILVGGIMPAINGNTRIGHSDNMITEACEYTNSFLSFAPTIGIILNVAADHLDFFKTMDNLRASFTKFCDNTTDILVVNGDDENTMRAVKASGFDKQIITFGKTDKNRYYPENIKRISDFQTDFDLMERIRELQRKGK